MNSKILIKESPVLQSKTRTGKVKYWRCIAFKHGEGLFYKKVWWQEGAKVQESTPVQVVGKNIGRANETTCKEQLLSEFDSLVQKQRDKGYSEDGSADHIPVKPMLANKYHERKHKIVWPCYAQPKLNGYRMLKEPDGKQAWTRGGKPHVPECVEHLMWFTPEVMTDGELLLPDMPVLQVTARAAKKFRKDGSSASLIYMIYDKVDESNPFPVRYMSLKLLEPTFPDQVKLVETIMVNNEEELFAAHARFTAQGYEGTIVRSGDDGYNIGHRSNSLLKLKDFQDSEFIITGVIEGKGSFKGKAIFVCETEDGYEFTVVPEGSHEYKAELWDTREDHIGKWLTVRYQDLSKDGAPQFPVGVVIREEGEF